MLAKDQDKARGAAPAIQIDELHRDIQTLLAIDRSPVPEATPRSTPKSAKTIYDDTAPSVSTRVGIHDDDERRRWAEDKRNMQASPRRIPSKCLPILNACFLYSSEQQKITSQPKPLFRATARNRPTPQTACTETATPQNADSTVSIASTACRTLRARSRDIDRPPCSRRAPRLASRFPDRRPRARAGRILLPGMRLILRALRRRREGRPGPEGHDRVALSPSAGGLPIP